MSDKTLNGKLSYAKNGKFRLHLHCRCGEENCPTVRTFFIKLKDMKCPNCKGAPAFAQRVETKKVFSEPSVHHPLACISCTEIMQMHVKRSGKLVLRKCKDNTYSQSEMKEAMALQDHLRSYHLSRSPLGALMSLTWVFAEEQQVQAKKPTTSIH